MDTSVIVFAVGKPHPLRDPAQKFFLDAQQRNLSLAVSAEVLQELLHVYLPADRVSALDSAFDLVERVIETVWSLDAEDVRLARNLHPKHPRLSSRDLVHLACCQRRNVRKAKTFDKALAKVFASEL